MPYIVAACFQSPGVVAGKLHCFKRGTTQLKHNLIKYVWNVFIAPQGFL